jgi:hypothetical protein
MQASDDREDNWEQLLRVLGRAAQRQLVSDDNERSAAKIQLRAIVTFLDQTAASGLITPLRILCAALEHLDSGAKPAKILAPRKPERRQRDDLILWTAKVGIGVIMDQLIEHARLSRKDAASEIAKVLREFGLSYLPGRKNAVTRTSITKWRDQFSKEAEFKRRLSVDAEALKKDAPLENKRDFLLKRRLPILLVQIGGQGKKAKETRQRLISEIGSRIPE